jgi:hypothetical protein
MGNKISGLSIRSNRFNNIDFKFTITKLNFKFDYKIFISFIRFVTKFFFNFRFICNSVDFTFNFNSIYFDIHFYISYLFFSKINKIPYKFKTKKFVLLKKYFKKYILNKFYFNYISFNKIYLKTYLNRFNQLFKHYFNTSTLVFSIKNITLILKLLKKTQLFSELKFKYQKYKKYFFGNTSFIIYDIFIQFFLVFYYKSFFFQLTNTLKMLFTRNKNSTKVFRLLKSILLIFKSYYKVYGFKLQLKGRIKGNRRKKLLRLNFKKTTLVSNNVNLYYKNELIRTKHGILSLKI